MKRIHEDWWPDRDLACHCVAYKFHGADKAAKLCKKHDLVIQAGGCVGTWPRYLRKTFSNVWTFEPSTENYELMLKNLSGVDVRMWNAALGERRGRCSMILNPTNCGDDRTTEGSEVEVIAIDDLGVSPDLIYLDIQGDELLALRGAKQTIEKCRPIIAIEWDGTCVKRHGDPVPYLKELGYVHVTTQAQDMIFQFGEV